MIVNNKTENGRSSAVEPIIISRELVRFLNLSTDLVNRSFLLQRMECSDPGVMTGLASEINHEKLK